MIKPTLVGQAPRIRTLMQAFAKIGLRFNDEWVVAVRNEVHTKRTEYDEMVRRDQESYSFDARETRNEIAEHYWQQKWSGLFMIRKHVEHEEDEYYRRARDRLGNGEFNPGSEVESSDYLSGMAAELQCATTLEFCSLTRVLDPLEKFAAEWQRYQTADDGGEDPVLIEGFVRGLERLLPLLLALSE